MKGAISGLAKASPVKTDSPSPVPGTPLQNTEDLARKVAEAKRRVAEAQTKLAVKDNPYMVSFFIS
jgi:U4/U6 small nuclear ribonucleoprotein PRP3